MVKTAELSYDLRRKIVDAHKEGIGVLPHCQEVSSSPDNSPVHHKEVQGHQHGDESSWAREEGQALSNGSVKHGAESPKECYGDLWRPQK